MLLSEFNDTIDSCGWFKKALSFIKKNAVAIAVTAVAVAVVATVAVAAPVFVTTVATAVMSSGGGAAALAGGISAGLAAAGSAVASSTLIPAAAATAAIAVGVAATADIAENIADGVIIDTPISGGVSDTTIEKYHKGVRYVLTTLTATAISKLAKNAYFLALANKDDGAMYYCATPINKYLAISIMAENTELSVYTYYESNARSIAQQAGNNMSPIWEKHHKYGYFDHYHLGNLSKPGEPHTRCRSHAFYGLPKFD